jgi:Tfp pilus assembly protein PilV
MVHLEGTTVSATTSITRRARRSRGTTLIEILISLAVVLVGLLALFRTLATSVSGSATASRLSQAQQRAVMVMEAIRIAPRAALDCLATTQATNWATCEATCRGTQTSAKPDWCVFKTLTVSTGGAKLRSASDANLQSYSLVTSNNKGGAAQVTMQGTGGRVYDAQVVIGWNEDNSDASTNPDHFIVLRSGVYEP